MTYLQLILWQKCWFFKWNKSSQGKDTSCTIQVECGIFLLCPSINSQSNHWSMWAVSMSKYCTPPTVAFYRESTVNYSTSAILLSSTWVQKVAERDGALWSSWKLHTRHTVETSYAKVPVKQSISKWSTKKINFWKKTLPHSPCLIIINNNDKKRITYDKGGMESWRQPKQVTSRPKDVRPLWLEVRAYVVLDWWRCYWNGGQPPSLLLI